MSLPELPEPTCFASINKQGDVTSTHKNRDAWRTNPLYTADLMRAYALQAVEALRREPMTEWQRLDAVRLNSEEFTGFYWLAMKGGKVAVGEYEWRQGWNPHGFNLIDGGRVCGTDVTHTMPFIRPELPNHITQKEHDHDC